MKRDKESQFANLPQAAADYIQLVIKKMGYRRKVRKDVQAELIAHFEDALADCKNENEKQEKAQHLIEEFGDAKLLGVLARRAKKRCRPLWRTTIARFFQTIGILFVCLILYCIYLSIGKPTISVNYVQKMNELARPAADENLNAAPLYREAIKLYAQEPNVTTEEEIRTPPRRHTKIASANEPPIVENVIPQKRMEKESLQAAVDKKQWPSQFTPEELSAMNKWIADNNESLAIFKRASLKPYCWWNYEAEDNAMYNVLLSTVSEREIAYLLRWRAKVEASQGRIDEAFDDVLTCYRAGMHRKGPRWLVEQLVGIMMEALACGTSSIILQEKAVSSLELQKFQNEFEKLTVADTFTVNFEVEKYCAYDVIQRCFTDNGCGSGHFVPSSFEQVKNIIDMYSGRNNTESNPSNLALGLGVALVSADRKSTIEKFESAFEKSQQWARTTPYQKHEANFDADRELGFTENEKGSYIKGPRYLLYYTLMPAFNGAIELSYRNRVQCQAVVAVLAVLRYKQDKGAYPETLNQLVEAEYLKQIPIDPWSDKPLVYKKANDNFTLYSVGKNFTDDGGKVYYDKKGRPQIWNDKEGDAVFWPVPKPKSDLKN